MGQDSRGGAPEPIGPAAIQPTVPNSYPPTAAGSHYASKPEVRADADSHHRGSLIALPHADPVQHPPSIMRRPRASSFGWTPRGRGSRIDDHVNWMWAPSVNVSRCLAIDPNSDYRTEKIPETKRPVVNPQWPDMVSPRWLAKSRLIHRQSASRPRYCTQNPTGPRSQAGKTQIRISRRDRPAQTRIDGHREPADDAQLNALGEGSRNRKVRAPGFQPQATRRHQENYRLTR
jgi:hypothetical protein